MTQRREKKNKRIKIYYFSLAFLSFSLPVASMFLGLNAKCILHLAFERSTANALGQSCNCKKITIELQYHSKFIIALLLNCKNKILIFIHSFSFFLTYFSLCLVLTLLSSPFSLFSLCFSLFFVCWHGGFAAMGVCWSVWLSARSAWWVCYHG